MIMAALCFAAIVTQYIEYLLDLDEAPATYAVLTPFARTYKQSLPAAVAHTSLSLRKAQHGLDGWAGACCPKTCLTTASMPAVKLYS